MQKDLHAECFLHSFASSAEPRYTGTLVASWLHLTTLLCLQRISLACVMFEKTNDFDHGMPGLWCLCLLLCVDTIAPHFVARTGASREYEHKPAGRFAEEFTVNSTSCELIT